MEHRGEIGFQVRALSNLIKRQVDQCAAVTHEMPTTAMQGWVIGYLYENRDKDVFQKDVQQRFSVRRSTVTGMLQLMEKNGLIVRSSVESDARLKKITLTPKAIEMHEQIVDGIKQVEQMINNSLTQQEQQTFIALCEKVRLNLEKQQNQRKDEVDT